MKSCVPCGASCEDAAPTCTNCGEASFLRVAVEAVAVEPPPEVAAVDAAPVGDTSAEPDAGGDAPEQATTDAAPDVADATVAGQPAGRGGRRRKVNPPPAPDAVN